MPYRVDGLEWLDAWLATDPPQQDRDGVFAFLLELTDGPIEDHHEAVPVASSSPVFTSIVPRTRVVVSYCVFEAPPWKDNKVVLLRVVTLP